MRTSDELPTRTPPAKPRRKADAAAQASRAASVLLALSAVVAVVFAVGYGGKASKSLSGDGPKMIAAASAKPAPDLTGSDEWLNSEPLTMQRLRGKVVLVEFWKYTCLNCRHEMPFIAALHETYARQGLVVVGVHSPEFDFERERANVVRATRELNITWPVAHDPERATWNAWQAQYWPSMYLVDRAGRIRYLSIGQGNEGNTEDAIRTLLDDGGDAGAARVVKDGKSGAHVPRQDAALTPELFLAGPRGRQALAYGIVPPGTSTDRNDAGTERNVVYLDGSFTGTEDSVEAAKAGARVVLSYHARDVYAVIERPAGATTADVEVLLDGKPVPEAKRGPDLVERDGKTFVRLDRDTLGHLLSTGSSADGDLTLVAHTPGVRFYVLKFRA